MENLKLNNKQENSYSMFLGLIAFLTIKDAIVSSIIEFKNSLAKFKVVIEEIASKAVLKGTVSEGKTQTKTDKRRKLEDAIIITSAALNAFGTKKNLQNVISIAKGMTKTYLKRLRDTDVVNNAMTIIELCEAHMSELSEYGINLTHIDELKNKQFEYSSSMFEKDVGFTSRKGTRKTLDDLFRSANRMLDEELDKFALRLRNEQPEFFNEYMMARKVVQAGIRHNKEPENPPPPAPSTALS